MQGIQIAVMKRVAGFVRRRLVSIVRRGRSGYVFLGMAGADIARLEREGR